MKVAGRTHRVLLTSLNRLSSASKILGFKIVFKPIQNYLALKLGYKDTPPFQMAWLFLCTFFQKRCCLVCGPPKFGSCLWARREAAAAAGGIMVVPNERVIKGEYFGVLLRILRLKSEGHLQAKWVLLLASIFQWKIVFCMHYLPYYENSLIKLISFGNLTKNLCFYSFFLSQGCKM